MTSPSSPLSTLRAGPSSAGPVAPRSGRDLVARILPWGLLAGFVSVLGLALGDRILPAREVALARVVAVAGEAAAVPDSAIRESLPPLFQASGWFEPDPLPVLATALIDGVVKEVAVLEGERVHAGQVLATLIDDDARLNLRTAESRLESLRALTEAQREQPAIIRSEMATLAKEVAAGEARRSERQDQVRRLDGLAEAGSGAVAEREVSLARLQLATAEAEIAALRARQEELLGRLRVEQATTRDFEARLAEAATEVERRGLELERTVIRSPLEGVVLRLVAVPGQKRMLAMDDPDSSTIAVLYDPARLQARIDVPLAEAAKLAPGQEVRLRASLFPDRVFRGEVTRIAGEADLQRNTLQAKVRVVDPDPRLRPEMLCRAEFLLPRPEEGATAAPATGTLRLFLPEAALTRVEGDAAVAWVVDLSGGAIQPVTLRLGSERREGHREVLGGLRPGDRVVLDPPDSLQSGERIREIPSSSHRP